MNTRNISETLTKSDVAELVAEKTSEPHYKVAKYVDATIDALREMMVGAKSEVRVELRGLGVFEVKLTKAKPKARNPKTGEIIFVPAHRKTHFKPSKLIKQVLAKEYAAEKIA
jgi:integration host factor subunit beta